MLRTVDAEIWLWVMLSMPLENGIPCRFSDNPGQVVVKDQVLIVPADNTLSVQEKLVIGHGWTGRMKNINDLIVEIQENNLKLTNNSIFIISWVAGQCAPFDISWKLTRPLLGWRVVGSAEKEAVAASVHLRVLVEVGLVVRTATIQGVQVKPWCAKVFCRTRVILLLKGAVRVEGQIVINKLTKIGVSGRDGWVLVGRLRCPIRGVEQFPGIRRWHRNLVENDIRSLENRLNRRCRCVAGSSEIRSLPLDDHLREFIQIARYKSHPAASETSVRILS
jgi:hypothetical protein